jgi:CubicO group peptidase (beta-lactamase class C family)
MAARLPLLRRAVRGLVLLGLLGLSPGARADPADEVDDYIASAMQAQHIPGLSLAVVREGRLVKAKGYGLANVELNAPATPETVYRARLVSRGSVSPGPHKTPGSPITTATAWTVRRRSPAIWTTS